MNEEVLKLSPQSAAHYFSLLRHFLKKNCHVLTFVRYIGVYYTFGLPDCIRYNKDFVISRFFPTYFTVTLAGLKSIGRHTGRGLHYIEVP